MIVIRNRGAQARSINLRREYAEIGRTIHLRPKEVRQGLPDEIMDEQDLTRLVGRGIVEVVKAETPETKIERRPRRGAESKTEREE